MKRLLFSLMALILLNAAAFGATYYVDGNLSSNCTGNYSIALRNCSGADGNAYKTIAGALAGAISPGDTINVRAGTYKERNSFTRSGSAIGGYITLQAYTGEKPIISGSGLAYAQWGMLSGTNVSYIKIQGMEIANYDGAGIAFYGAVHHIQILNNELHNQIGTKAPYGHAILVTSLEWPNVREASDITISGNYIHHVVTGTPEVFNEALTVAWDVDRVTITNNTLDYYSHIGIDLIGKTQAGAESYLPNTEPITSTPWPRYVYIAGNRVSHGQQQRSLICASIYIDGAQYVVIENNSVHDNRDYGIVVSTESADFTTGNVIVRRNRSYNNGYMAFGSGNTGKLKSIRVIHNVFHASSSGSGTMRPIYGSDAVTFRNNISFSRGTYHLLHDRAALPNPMLDYNVYYPSTGIYYFGGKYYLNFSAYQTGSGQETHGLSADPLFVDNPTNFKLQSASPAIDAGGNLTTVSSNSGTGTSIVVADASYFSDGFGISDKAGDQIMIGSDVVTITKVDYETNTISFFPSIGWVKGEGVNYLFSGAAPDIGAYEYGSYGNVFDAPIGLRVVETAQ